MNKTQEQLNNNNLIPRSPIVVIMGHVDHGKTSILDYIRKSRVAEKEAGGITQHIGAYEIEISFKDDENRKITFIDTPGHEAFSKMRSRGARVADIAVLVMAADEGFKPQTKEAVSIIKNEKLPFIVAANKIDKPGVNLELIKKKCGENEIYIEEWGGETPFVPVSAKTGEGINLLLETMLLLSDIHEFKADPNKNAAGFVLESHLDKRRGNTATLIIQDGTIKKGMFVLCGEAFTSIKILENFLGNPVNSASFSSPVRIAGFNILPPVGSVFNSFNSKEEIESRLREVAGVNEKLFVSQENAQKNFGVEIYIVLKADTAGSLEALEGEIMKLENENVKINIIAKKTGNITEDDIKSAFAAKNSVIVGFNTGIEPGAKNLIERKLATVKIFNIIYKLTEWLKEEIIERAPVETVEELTGKAEILKVFKKELPREILGGRVISGKIIKGGYFKPVKKSGFLAPETVQQFLGKITELEKNKLKAEEAKEGSEFGIAIETKKEIKEGDVIEVYEKKSFKKKVY